MTIGIQNTPIGFTDSWINYCKKNEIDFKLIDSYANNVIEQLEGCDVFMWHHDLILIKDNLVAKRLLFALEHAGKLVFPGFYDGWHYDDKIAQKYLLEAIKAPTVPTYVFYDKKEALNWVENVQLPKVFKLKGGAGSANVQLVRTVKDGKVLIKKAFGKGFAPVNKEYYLKESFRKFREKKINIVRLIKNTVRYFLPTNNKFVKQKELNYAYFQDFIPNNNSDFRIVVINKNKAFGLQRFVRENDFRASGSGSFKFLSQGDLQNNVLQMIFEVSNKLKMDSVAYDIVFDESKNPLIIEISYAYVSKAYNSCPGYWNSDLEWVDGYLSNYQEWMIENKINQFQND
jgi:glutathione synthase/RimK-type ligase-like ATP-grasp enzyme